MKCPICNRDLSEEELLDGIGPCWSCKIEQDNDDYRTGQEYLREVRMPLATGVVHTYNGLIPDMRKSGYTLQEICDHCGVSRERIRQVLEKYYHNPKSGLLSEHKVAELLEVSSFTLACMRKKGAILPVHHGNQWHYDTALIEKVRALVYKPCRLCGKAVKCRTYCPECGKKVRHNRYLVMSPEEKKAHCQRTQSWQKRHPDRWKKMAAKAGRNYRAREKINHWESNPKYLVWRGRIKLGHVVTAVDHEGRFIITEEHDRINLGNVTKDFDHVNPPSGNRRGKYQRSII